jgi:cytoskeletal protein CcmA (bactofilin family)
MFSSKKSDTTPKYDQVDTLIGKNSVFRGNMDAEGTLRIEGSMEGELNIKGDVVLADTGKVTGNIIATNAHIAGKIEGNIKVASQLHLTQTSFIDGDIEVGNLIVDEGAVFTGKCAMGNKAAQPSDELKQEAKFNTKQSAE